MPRRNQHAKRMYNFVMPIHQKLKQNYPELSTYVDTCWNLYCWYPPFGGPACQLRKQSEEAFVHYKDTTINEKGLVRLKWNEDKSAIEMEKYEYKAVLELKGKNTSIQIVIMPTEENLTLAENWLKKSFPMEESEVQCIVKTTIERILIEWHKDTIDSYVMQLIKNGQSWYRALAVVLIYAQSQTLPESENEYITTEHQKNIFIASKKEMETLYSLEERCSGAIRMTLVNYAGTAFFANRAITAEADLNWSIFLNNMIRGRTKVRIVLTDPKSPAARDAETYKMRPKTIKRSVEDIISDNIKDIRMTAAKFCDYDLSLYLTDVALPCAYFISEFQNPERNNIKVDLYLPSFSDYVEIKEGEWILEDEDESDDNNRQSFMIFYKDNPKLYNRFKKNAERILRNAEKVL